MKLKILSRFLIASISILAAATTLAVLTITTPSVEQHQGQAKVQGENSVNGKPSGLKSDSKVAGPAGSAHVQQEAVAGTAGSGSKSRPVWEQLPRGLVEHAAEAMARRDGELALRVVRMLDWCTEWATREEAMALEDLNRARDLAVPSSTRDRVYRMAQERQASLSRQRSLCQTMPIDADQARDTLTDLALASGVEDAAVDAFRPRLYFKRAELKAGVIPLLVQAARAGNLQAMALAAAASGEAIGLSPQEQRVMQMSLERLASTDGAMQADAQTQLNAIRNQASFAREIYESDRDRIGSLLNVPTQSQWPLSAAQTSAELEPSIENLIARVQRR